MVRGGVPDVASESHERQTFKNGFLDNGSEVKVMLAKSLQLGSRVLISSQNFYLPVEGKVDPVASTA